MNALVLVLTIFAPGTVETTQVHFTNMAACAQAQVRIERRYEDLPDKHAVAVCVHRWWDDALGDIYDQTTILSEAQK